MDVAQVLDTLVRALPAGAAASWLAPDGAAVPGVPAPEPRVAALVAALAAAVTRDGGDLAGDSSSLLVESPARTLLAHRLGGHGTLVVVAGPDLNLALVRRLVRTALADGEPPAAPEAADAARDAPARDEPPLPALPRRARAARVTDFRYEPEDAEVLRQLREALTG